MPDDERSVVKFETPSEESFGPSSPAGGRESCNRHLARVKSLTLEKGKVNKSVDKDISCQKLKQGDTKVPSEKAALDKFTCQGFSDIKVIEGSSVGVGLSDEQLDKELTLNMCGPMNSVLMGLQPSA